MVYCFIQCRVGSSRLYGKVLLNICGKSVLQHTIERVQYSKLINKIIVATSTNIENNAIESLCNQLNISCFRGSEDDILSRFQGAIKYYNIQDDDLIVRICCDCPLTDPLIIDDIIHFHGDNDLTTNCIVRTFPDGLDVECFKAGILKHPNFNEINFFELEYNINFLFNNNFKIFNLFNQKGDLSHLRWTLDTPADFEFIKGIYEKFYHSGKMFLMEDILKCLGENK